MGSERIYIGGLDPNRGLSVEVVASRLHSVKNIEIMAINDVPVRDRGDATSILSKPIYDPKHRVIDEDGDLVDTRKFFYIEARPTNATSGSALDILAKQYHNTKWKGCSLRVEEAKPHFLKRLEHEREERKAKAAAVTALLSTDLQEMQSKEEDCVVDEQGAKNEEVKKSRRRLRIRQRFGAEAYLVDTHPRQLHLGNGSTDGWKDFASLRKRMINKRESQRRNLVERRKQERRSWAGGNGNIESNASESSDLRSLIFLNRGIHIRFDSIEASDLVSDDNSDSSKGKTEDITEDDETSSSSDSDYSSVERNGDDQNSYKWSDEEDDVSMAHDENEFSSESGEEEEAKSGAMDNDDESIVRHFSKPTRTNNLKAGAEYTRAVVADEFAFGADFDFDDDAESANSDSLAINEPINIDLGEDISSNINILAKLFPGDHFDNKPIADALTEGHDKESGDMKEKQKFGAGIILQRYDPTKDIVKKSEKSKTSTVEIEKVTKEDARVEEQSTTLSPAENASISSESSESLRDETTEEETTMKSTETPTRNEVVEETKEDVYEQDELENVFKQSRQELRKNTGGGFSFGFQVPAEATADQISPFSFGFNVSDEPNGGRDTTTATVQVSSEEVKDDVEEKISPAVEKIRRFGLKFPENDLKAYEDFFFSLNEGPRILRDLDAMKQDEDNQTLWQKEREQLTSDWKRKQKAAQSRRVKQKRR